MYEIKPPTPIEAIEYRELHDKVKIFTAGSIDMGNAEDWQSEFVEHFKDHDIVLLNPRRDNWDPNWEQSIDNPEFAYQVNWELDGLQEADIVALYFGATTTSIISMMELGMFASSGKVIIHCPKEFWRRGNIEVCASRNPVTLVDGDKDLWYEQIEDRIKSLNQG